MHLKDILNALAKFTEIVTIYLDTKTIHDSAYSLCDLPRLEDYRNRTNDNFTSPERGPQYNFDCTIEEPIIPDAPTLFAGILERSASQAVNARAASSCAKRISGVMHDRHMHKCFIYLESAFSYFVAESLAKLRVDIIPIILDPPDSLFYFYEYNGYMKSLVNSKYKYVVRNSFSIVSASPQAVRMLIGDGAKSALSAPAVHRGKKGRRPPSNRLTSKNGREESSLRFVMAGQAYASSTIFSFLNALDTYSQETGKNIVFDYFGSQFDRISFEANSDSLVVANKGVLPYHELMEILPHYDIGYVPYPFEKELENTCRFSFPSKLTSYVESGIIPLFHGPIISSPTEILREVKLEKLIICSERREDILSSITRLNKLLLDYKEITEYIRELAKIDQLFSRDSLEHALGGLVR